MGRYGGDQYQRDGAYHQGTVWSWLIGPFVRAHLRVYQNPTLARSFLLPLLRHLSSDCAGNISIRQFKFTLGRHISVPL